VDPQPWQGGTLIGKLAAWCYGGWKLTVIGGKGRGANRDPHRGWRRAVECQSWAGNGGEEQSGVELIGGNLLAHRSKIGEGNEHGEEWGSSWAAFIGWEGGETAGRGRVMAVASGAL
jgi:hypothetical protein